MSSQFVLLDTRRSVLQKLPKAFREKSYKIFAQSPRIKKLVFQKKVSENDLLDTQIAVLNSTRNHSATLRKIEYCWKLCFLSEHSRRHRGSRCDNSTQCFVARSQNMAKIWILFHSIYLFLKMFHWRWWMLSWKPWKFRLKLRNCFTYCVEPTKKTLIFPKGSTIQYCSTGHKKTVWASCQTFLARIQKEVTFIKVFKELFSSKSFSGWVKGVFDRLTETTFAKFLLGYCS